MDLSRHLGEIIIVTVCYLYIIKNLNFFLSFIFTFFTLYFILDMSNNKNIANDCNTESISCSENIEVQESKSKKSVDDEEVCFVETPKPVKFNRNISKSEIDERIISPPSSIQSVDTYRENESNISFTSSESSDNLLKINKRLSISSSSTPITSSSTSTPDSKLTQTPNTSNYYYHQSSFRTPSISSVFPPSIRYLMNSNTPSPMKSYNNSPVVNIKPNLLKSNDINEYYYANSVYKLNENEFDDIVEKLDESDLLKLKCDLEKLIEESNHQLINELMYSSELNDAVDELDRKSREVSIKAQKKYKI